jgi:hypothetical protein
MARLTKRTAGALKADPGRAVVFGDTGVKGFGPPSGAASPRRPTAFRYIARGAGRGLRA